MRTTTVRLVRVSLLLLAGTVAVVAAQQAAPPPLVTLQEIAVDVPDRYARQFRNDVAHP